MSLFIISLPLQRQSATKWSGGGNFSAGLCVLLRRSPKGLPPEGVRLIQKL